MKCLYECLDKEWFKCALDTAKDLEGNYKTSYLLGMRSALRYRVKWDLTQRQERLYLHLITKEMGRQKNDDK